MSLLAFAAECRAAALVVLPLSFNILPVRTQQQTQCTPWLQSRDGKDRRMHNHFIGSAPHTDTICLQCIDAVGWAARRASSLYKTVMVYWRGYLCGAKCRLAYGPAYATATQRSCFSKIQIVFTFLVPAYPGSPGQRSVKWVCLLNIPILRG